MQPLWKSFQSSRLDTETKIFCFLQETIKRKQNKTKQKD